MSNKQKVIFGVQMSIGERQMLAELAERRRTSGGTLVRQALQTMFVNAGMMSDQEKHNGAGLSLASESGAVAAVAG